MCVWAESCFFDPLTHSHTCDQQRVKQNNPNDEWMKWKTGREKLKHLCILPARKWGCARHFRELTQEVNRARGQQFTSCMVSHHRVLNQRGASEHFAILLSAITNGERKACSFICSFISAGSLPSLRGQRWTLECVQTGPQFTLLSGQYDNKLLHGATCPCYRSIITSNDNESM